MDDACYRRLASIVDVCHCARNSSCSRYATKDWAEHVGHALAYQLLVRVVLMTNYTIGHRSREKALYGTKHSYGDGWREKAFYCVPVKRRDGRLRHRWIDFKTVAYGVDMNAKIIGHDDACHRHDDDSHKRAWHLFAHKWSESYDDDGEKTHYCRGKVYCAEVVGIAYPFLNKIGRHAAIDMQSEKIFHLCGKNGHGDTAGEAHNDGVWYVTYDCSQLKHSEQDEE